MPIANAAEPLTLPSGDNVLEHWIAENRPPNELEKSWSITGSRWRTLETGIRACALFDDLEIFMDAPAFDADAKTLLTGSLIEHARRGTPNRGMNRTLSGVPTWH